VSLFPLRILNLPELLSLGEEPLRESQKGRERTLSPVAKKRKQPKMKKKKFKERRRRSRSSSRRSRRRRRRRKGKKERKKEKRKHLAMETRKETDEALHVQTKNHLWGQFIAAGKEKNCVRTTLLKVDEKGKKGKKRREKRVGFCRDCVVMQDT